MMEFTNIDIRDFACFINETLKNEGIDAVLVGWCCVSIYSQNQYQSYDLDFVTYNELKQVERALAKEGFKRNGKYFTHDKCPFLIDFVNPPIAVCNEMIHHFETLKTSIGSLQLLAPTDCVKDPFLDLQDIERWAKKRRASRKNNRFLNEL